MAWNPFRHLGLKLLAVVLASLLWMTVTRDQLVERSLRVPLEFQNIPETLEITGDAPTAVDARLRGPSSTLGRLQPGDVLAVLDLRGARPGQRLFHLLTEQVTVPFGIEVSQVAPATISLTFERSGSRVIPVVPNIDGEPAFGFIAGKITTDPPSVEIVGPLSHLNDLREATTEPVSVKDATETIRDSVTVGVADPALRLKVPRAAHVTVEILPAPIERAVHQVPVRARNVGRGLHATLDPTNVTVVLRGSREALGSLDSDNLEAWVDVASLGPGRYTLAIKFDPGKDYGLSRVEPSIVEVRVH